jgi:hypothetical protein
MPRLVGKLEPHRPGRLVLGDGRMIECIAIGSHVTDADGDNVSATQLAVDRQVEKREISSLRDRSGCPKPNPH